MNQAYDEREDDTLTVLTITQDEASLRGFHFDCRGETRCRAEMGELLQLLERLDAKGKRLNASIARADELAVQLERPAKPPAADPYQQATELIRQGCSDDDVHSHTGLSREEITLIRQLVHLQTGART